MDMQLIVTLSLIHLVALVSPGPDFAIIIRLATLESRAVALAAALGIALAIGIHTLLSLTGISLAIHDSPRLYSLVQAIGASYLGWMGLGAIRSALAARTTTHGQRSDKDFAEKNAPRAAEEGLKQSLRPYQGLKIGLFTNLLNPKALVFFITLFSALVTPSVTISTKVSIGIMLVLLSFIWFALVSVLLSHSQVQQRFQRLAHIVDGITGTLFLMVAFGILYQLIL